VFDSLKRKWHEFAERKPGTRFSEMYEEHQRSGQSGTKRVLFVIAGVVIVAVGIVALPAPGPGTLVIALGAGLIARESRKLAHALDRLELALRGLWKKIKRARKESARSEPARLPLGKPLPRPPAVSDARPARKRKSSRRPAAR
jgi:hypothetical protein